MIHTMNSGYFVFEDNFSQTITPERITHLYEMEFCTSGEGYSVVDGKKYPHQINRFLFTKPNQKRYSIGRFECYYIKFSCEDKDFEAKYLQNLPTTIVPNNPFEILSLFTNACSKHEKSFAYFELYMEGVIKQLISLYSDNSFPFSGNNYSSYQKYGTSILNSKDFMNVNFGEKLTLNSIASVANLSPNFFRIVFKELMGISPHRYLLNLRLLKAKQYLTNTDYLLSDIAVLCGFETQSYMNYIFRKFENKTPLQYRIDNQIYL